MSLFFGHWNWNYQKDIQFLFGYVLHSFKEGMKPFLCIKYKYDIFIHVCFMQYCLVKNKDLF